MFYALVENQDWFKNKVDLFVAFAPVIRFKYAEKELKEATSHANLAIDALHFLADQYSIGGPGFDKALSNIENYDPLGSLLSHIFGFIHSLSKASA